MSPTPSPRAAPRRRTRNCDLRCPPVPDNGPGCSRPNDQLPPEPRQSRLREVGRPRGRQRSWTLRTSALRGRSAGPDPSRNTRDCVMSAGASIAHEPSAPGAVPTPGGDVLAGLRCDRKIGETLASLQSCNRRDRRDRLRSYEREPNPVEARTHQGTQAPVANSWQACFRRNSTHLFAASADHRLCQDERRSALN